MTHKLSGMMQFLSDRYIGDDPVLVEALEEERWNNHIAQLVYDLRIQTGLSQKELADKAGIHESVVAQLEEADYDGNVMDMFRTIVTALDKKIEIRVVA